MGAYSRGALICYFGREGGRLFGGGCLLELGRLLKEIWYGSIVHTILQILRYKIIWCTVWKTKIASDNIIVGTICHLTLCHFFKQTLDINLPVNRTTPLNSLLNLLTIA